MSYDVRVEVLNSEILTKRHFFQKLSSCEGDTSLHLNITCKTTDVSFDCVVSLALEEMSLLWTGHANQ